jgi:hypothetical protein
MHPTVTHFATCLPDWNSLDSVRRAHSDLEAAALVFFALLVVCEALAHLSDDKKTERRFDRIGIVFFAVAVLAEIAAYPYGQRNDFLSAQVIGSLDAKSKEASTNASSALTKSGAAETKANEAETKSKEALTRAHAAERSLAKAEADAGKAQDEAANALNTATDASTRAGKAETSLGKAEAEAKGAETSASNALALAKDAESHLADALQRAANAEAELERMRAPRSLMNTSGLTDTLKVFTGTEYTFIGCFQDQESIDLLVQLDKVLANAGWTRVKPPPQSSFADIQLNISKDFGVPITTRSGVYVGVQSSVSLDALKATPQPMLPAYIRAAMALKGGLAAGISPAEPNLNLAAPLPVEPGTSTSVFIIVGKKL